MEHSDNSSSNQKPMNKTYVFTTSIFAVAIALLFVLHFSSASCSKNADANGVNAKGDIFPVAYVDTDSLLLQYNYAKAINEDILKKEEKLRASFNEKAKVFQTDAADFQRKVQNNGFLSLDRAQQAQEDLRRREAELQELNQKLSNELMAEQDRVTRALRENISSFLQEYNKEKGYKLILSNTMGANVLFSDKSTNITKEVVIALNKKYDASKK